MKKQDPKERVKNFDEVALGFTEEEAVEEAKRCITCKKPFCVLGCPVEIDIPRFITAIKEKKFDEAAKIIKERNSLPAVCGRVCPQEDQCEKVCVVGKKGRAINIGALERFAADWEMKNRLSVTEHRTPNTEHRIKVAVIGSGPAGLTCAADLAKLSYDVTIFESLHKAGGVLAYGIPNFRLPSKIIHREIEYIKSLGVNVELNMVIGRSITVEKLEKKGFKAFFVGTGAGLPSFLGIEGEDLNGVYSANEFLTRINLMKAYTFPRYDTPIRVGKRVAVIGGGNVAMDSARSAKRISAEEVIIVYRRTEKEMPARIDEIKNAKEEGIKFELLTNPTRAFGDNSGWINSMECLRNRLGEADSSGRPRPVPIEGSQFIMKIDSIVIAIGQGPNPLLLSTIKGLNLTKNKNINADRKTGATSIKNIFAGGDVVTGAATVIEAMGAGKRAAQSIDEYLKNE